ncbi:MAG TPA: thymidine phosphorylase [Acidimicrobiia bacterium]|nr:thymidine phosphorylase [Acidimicrobiia bacterium]
MPFTAVELIEIKRDRGTLSPEAIDWLIQAYTEGSVTDYQMSAMAMAIFLNGLDSDELAAWTSAMLHSGEVLDCSDIPAPKVDKHSTGGVGDKISIALAPLVAVCGVAVPMMSGRGLGHTGGTLDKLETIPGFTTGLDPERFRAVLTAHHLVLAGQSETLVPADRKLYALRDATATVPSIPLIASSIMSKKLAEGLDGLLLDVKTGSGAFMKDLDRSRELAQTMVGIGTRHGVRTVALITRMDQPLGREVGNANELRESIEVLNGGGPEDIVELTLAFGEVMLDLAGIDGGRDRLQESIASGAALQKLVDVAEAQGGDASVIRDPSLLATAPHEAVIEADRSGYVTRCDALIIGTVATRLGAGRERKDDVVDPGVGITVAAKLGEKVEKGQPLATVRFSDPARWEAQREMLATAWSIEDASSELADLIVERIEAPTS